MKKDTRVCKRCGQDRPIYLYWLDRDVTCAVCRTDRTKGHPVWGFQGSPDGFKRCCGCESLKPVSEFRKDIEEPGGKSRRCSECIRQQEKKKRIERAANKALQEKLLSSAENDPSVRICALEVIAEHPEFADALRWTAL